MCSTSNHQALRNWFCHAHWSKNVSTRLSFWFVSQSRASTSGAHAHWSKSISVVLVCKPITSPEPGARNSGSSELCNSFADWMKGIKTANQKACLTWLAGACLARDFLFVEKDMALVCIIHKLLGDGNSQIIRWHIFPGGSSAWLGPLPRRILGLTRAPFWKPHHQALTPLVVI